MAKPRVKLMVNKRMLVREVKMLLSKEKTNLPAEKQVLKAFGGTVVLEDERTVEECMLKANFISLHKPPFSCEPDKDGIRVSKVEEFLKVLELVKAEGKIPLVIDEEGKICSFLKYQSVTHIFAKVGAFVRVHFLATP